jgi:hypothetical protein
MLEVKSGKKTPLHLQLEFISMAS